MHHRDRNPEEVYKLASLNDYKLEHREQDLRGKTLMDRERRPIGRIDDMLVDLDHERVAALRMEDDRIIDIDAVEIVDDQPVLLVGEDRIPKAAPDFDRNNITSKHIPIIEEELKVGKREVQTGGIRVHSRTVEKPVHENVTLREEHVDVERRPVDRAVSGGEARAMFKDRDVEMTARSEEAVVAKEARVAEEVVVSKDTETRTEQVDDTVRHTEVDVDRDPGTRR